MFPAPNRKAVSAIHDSDAIVYSIGSLYTSLAPNLILDHVGPAIATGSARFKILILNGSLDRETGGYGAIDFVRAIVGACEASSIRASSSSLADSSLSSNQGNGIVWTGDQTLVAKTVRKYLTHLVYIDHPAAPQVEKNVLMAWGVETVKVYGRKGEDGKMRYDGKALGQALGMVLGKRDGREGAGRSRRNTVDGAGGGK